MALGMPEGGAQAMLGAESTKKSSRSIGGILKSVLGLGGLGAALGFAAQLLPLPFVGGAGFMAIAVGGALGATLGLVKAMRGGGKDDEPAAGALPDGQEVPVAPTTGTPPAPAAAPTAPAKPSRGKRKPKGSHTVKRGDTLSAIAKRHNIDWRKLYEANKEAIGSNPNMITPGMDLALPR
jgi:LysM repeat protein